MPHLKFYYIVKMMVGIYWEKKKITTRDINPIVLDVLFVLLIFVCYFPQ